MNQHVIPIGLDAGNGAFKIYSTPGGLEIASQVATRGTQRIASTLGLRKQKPPLQVINNSGTFYVGEGAHDYGHPVENLDVDRFHGTPEMTALLHGSLTRYQEQYGAFNLPLLVITGLPNEVLMGNSAQGTIDNVKRWLRGSHEWQADRHEYTVQIADIKVASQATGGLFDYLLDDSGKFVPDRKPALTNEAGVISIGFGTVELMVVRDRMPVQRFTSGFPSGVRRMLEILNEQHLYSLGEMDALLRMGQLDLSSALPIWEREVMGVIEKQWGNIWKRFSIVILVGGGALILREALLYRFEGKAYLPDNPVLSIARGLYKMSLLQQNVR